MSEVIERLEVRVSGRVQGVGFRHFTAQQAKRLGVDGWVRNERDGSVRVVAEGRRDVLEDFLERLQEGPGGARVQDLNPDWTTASGEFSGFAIRFF